MQTATLSSKFQLAIPKMVRENLNLKAGQKFMVITKGRIIELVPVPSLQAMRGILQILTTIVIVRIGFDRFS